MFASYDLVDSKTMSFKLSEVNNFTEEEFVEIFGNTVEHCPDAAKHAFTKRPFKMVQDLVNAFHDFLNGLSVEGKFQTMY